MAFDLRSTAGRVTISLNIGRRWSRAESKPEPSIPLDAAPLYAVIPTWCEEDVIAATVANAFAQGCQRVFLIDNDSPDATVPRALAAGAEIGCIYHTQYWDDFRKMAEIGAVIDKVSTGAGVPHIWWMLCDADEFVHGPAGQTVADYVAGLDRRFRIVGARVFNHFPSTKPQYVEQRHPLDFQPLCHEVRVAWCSLRHWKHPLIRWDRKGPPITPRVGFHRVDCVERVIEPLQGLYLHHFPFRDQATTLDRLNRLCGGRSDQPPRSALESSRQGNRLDAERRYATFAHVYAGQWDQVERPVVVGTKRGVNVRPWAEQVPAADSAVARWYSER